MEGVLKSVQEMFKSAEQPISAVVVDANLVPPGSGSLGADKEGEHTASPDQSQQKGRRNAPVPKLLPEDFEPCRLPRRPFRSGLPLYDRCGNTGRRPARNR
jgi:hypothetical protein